MAWYFAMAVVLGFFAILETGERSRLKPFGIASAVLLALFAGLRFETGYDWAAYETYFYLLPTLTEHISPSQSRAIMEMSGLSFEPGFDGLCRLVKTLGLDYHWLFLVVSSTNFLALYILISKLTGRISLVLLVYYGLAFMSGQMAEVRQSFGTSFIFFAILCEGKRRRWLRFALCVLAVSFQVFTIVLIPFVFINRRLPHLAITSAIIGLGLISTFIGVDIIPALVRFISPLVGGFLGDKLSSYGETSGNPISLATAGIIIWHIAALFLLTRRQPPANSETALRDEDRFTGRLHNIAIYATVLSLLAHGYLASSSIFWLRIMLFTLPIQVAELARMYEPVIRPYAHRIAVCASATAMAALSLFYFLADPQSAPFVPYQSGLSFLLTGERGNGRLRYEMHVEEAAKARQDALRP